MPTDTRSAPQVSIIIPTLNAGAVLTELLHLLQNQSLKPYEIIIIDSMSEDGTAERARTGGAQVLTVARSEFDHGGTRNQAAEYAKGDILMFMTQDALPYNEKLVEHLVKSLLDQEKVVYAYARQLARPEANDLERLARQQNYPEASHVKSFKDIERLGIKTFFCSNVCSAIKRTVFLKMGKFQEPVIFNEDLFMAARSILSGYKVVYCAEAIVYHSHDYTIGQQFRRYFDNGISMKCNTWITPYSAVGKAGSKLIKEQMKELMRMRKQVLIPRLLVEAAAKLVGYKLGFHYRHLPAFLCKRFSMHKLILNQIAQVSSVETQHTIKQ